MGTMMSELLKGGGKMDLLEVALSVVLMQEFGAKPLPKTIGLQPINYDPDYVQQHTYQSVMISVIVGVVVKCLMTVIQGKDLDAKKMVIKFLTKGPLSLKEIGVKGAVDMLVKNVLSILPSSMSVPLYAFITVAAGKMLGAAKGVETGVLKTTLSKSEAVVKQVGETAGRAVGLVKEQKTAKKPPTLIGPKGHMKPRRRRRTGK